jgi:hypothetical protein
VSPVAEVSEIEGGGKAVAAKAMAIMCPGEWCQRANNTKMPLTVFAPTFLTKQIGQSTDWPGATNTMTMTLSANVELDGSKGAQIVISDLLSQLAPPYVVGDTAGGIACPVSGIHGNNQTAYVFFSTTAVQARFGYAHLHEKNAQHFICVQHDTRLGPCPVPPCVVTQVNICNAALPCNMSDPCAANGTDSTNGTYLMGCCADVPMSYATTFCPKPNCNNSDGWTYMDYSKGGPRDNMGGKGDNSNDNMRGKGDNSNDNMGSKGDSQNGNDEVVKNSMPQAATWRWTQFKTVPTDMLVFKVAEDGSVISLGDTKEVLHSIVLGYKGVGSDVDMTANPYGTDDKEMLDILVTGDFLQPHYVVVTASTQVHTASTLRHKSESDNKHKSETDKAVAMLGDDAYLFESPGLMLGGVVDVTGPAQSYDSMTLSLQSDILIEMGASIVLSFNVLNSMIAQPGAPISVAAMTPCTTIPKSATTEEGPPTAFSVVAAKVLVFAAGQSSPFPCTTNTLMVTISTNFHLKSKDLSMVTMSGFGGAIVGPENTAMTLHGGGGEEHNMLFAGTRGLWQKAVASVALEVASGKNLIAGREYRFSFDVENPVVTVASEYLPANEDGLAKATVYEPNTLQLQTTGDYQSDWGINAIMTPAVPRPGRSLNLCNNSDPLDGSVLFLYKPMLTVKEINQDNAKPCGENTMSVTLQTNVALCARDSFSQITMSGFTGAVPIMDPLNRVRLMGSGDQDTFAAAVKGHHPDTPTGPVPDP